jgi:hypothetical protein
MEGKTLMQFGIELFLTAEGHLITFAGENEEAFSEFINRPENVTLEEAVTGLPKDHILRFDDAETETVRKRLAGLGFIEIPYEDYMEMDISAKRIVAAFML